ncbi:MAG: sensor histidine kinase [Deltaproteobacteria bacterium]|nr:sensor histidine kinase [Deltaproteobacteria bacterium]
MIALSSMVLFIAGYFAFASRYLAGQLEERRVDFFQSLEPFVHRLHSARWVVGRYEHELGRKNHVSGAVMALLTDHMLITDHMLHVVFGAQRSYFFLRSNTGATPLALYHGQVLRDFGDLRVPGMMHGVAYATGTSLHHCTIAEAPWLCLIDVPHARQFVSPDRRAYMGFAFPVEHVQTVSPSSDEGTFFFPRIQLAVKLGERSYPQFKKNAALLHHEMPLGKGVALQISFPAAALCTRMVSLLIGFLLVEGALFWCAFSVAKKMMAAKAERDALQCQVEQYVRMQEVIRGIRHDIQSPLATIRAFMQQESSPQGRVLLGHVTKRMQMIVEDLSRSGAAAFPAEQIYIPLHCALRLFLLEKEREHPGRMLTGASPLQSCWIMGSYSSLLRAFSNVVNNAIEASPTGQPVVIAVQSAGEFVTITVSDTGIGIPPEYVAKVFDRGVSLGKQGGTGFGLFQAKTTVESFGGTIALTSRPGRGTQVTMQIPRCKAPRWGVEQLHLGAISRIVLVDDESACRTEWRTKLAPYLLPIVEYGHPSEIPDHSAERELLLIDNNFGREYGLGAQYISTRTDRRSHLVTNDWSAPAVQQFAQQHAIPMIGKEFMGSLEVVI